MNETEIRAIATEAANAAISQLRKTQKRGRKDTAGGSTEVGACLRKTREENEWSITEMADESGLHATTIGKIEAGQRGMSLKTFARLWWVLGTAFSDCVLWQIGK